MAITPLLSRVEEILAGSNVTPMSRIEVLLVELINYIETGLSSVFHYRGSVQAYSDLSSITNPEVGDVYNVIADGMDYAWTGEAWDSLGTLVIVASEITSDGQAPVTSQAIYNALATKVDKINGKGLSTNDFTDDLLQKLTGIAAGAEANVQSDWNQSDNTADDYIKNKPTLGTAASHDVASAIGDTTDIPTAALVNTALAGKQDSLSTAQMNAANSGATAAKVTQYDKDSAALPEVVDGGAKNLSGIGSSSATASITDKRIIPAGSYVISYANLTSDDTDATYCRIIAIASDGETIVSTDVHAERNGGYYYLFDITSDAQFIRIYASKNTTSSSGDTVSVTNFMLCTKSAWDVSQKYVPYCPSMAELNDGGILSRVYGDENVVDIPSNADLDTYMTPGIYSCSLSTVASTLDNCPTKFGFKMEIRTTASSTRLSQIIYENVATGDMYVRAYAGSGWGVWNHIETDNSVFGRGTLIASGTDLDNLTSIGAYYSNDKTKSQSLTNSPFTMTGFTLEVKKSYQSQSSTDGINQIAYSYVNNAFTIKARTLRYLSSPAPGAWSWTDWQTLAFTAET